MRGQVSYEFLGTVVVAMLIFTVLAMYIITQFGMLLPFNNQNREAQFFADRLALAVSAANTFGDGYKATISMPQQIRSRDYRIYSGNTSIEMDITDLGDVDSYADANIPAPVLLYNPGPGDNTVVNTNGTIIIYRQ